MRSLLALLIGLALAMSPVTSAMAAPTCAMNGAAAMAGMGAPGMPGMTGMTIAAAHKTGTDPCCDHAAKSGRNCAQACAAICCVGLVLPSMAASPRPFVQWTAATTVPVIAPRSYAPTGLDPPPKSIA